MSKRKREEASSSSPQSINTNQPPTVYTSSRIQDRNSMFQAIFTASPLTAAEQKSLQGHPPFSLAMHKILAWRRPSSQRSISSSFGSSSQQQQDKRMIYETGSDEDGEKYAGKKVERVLVEMGVEEGTVVVARWWGGVMLGPVRFKWIEDCAREAITKWKKGTGMEGEKGEEEEERAKKMKVDESVKVVVQGEGKQKERLVVLLKERDQSVAVLRSLLAEKNELLNAGAETATGNTAGKTDLVKSPMSAAPDYSSLPLDRLKQLEKARDATLSWILKQIDTVEEKLKTTEKPKNA